MGVAVLGVLLVTAVGCFHTHPHHPGIAADHPPIAVPPPGTVPVELNKITLPPYVIEAPDNLLIQVFVKARVPVDDKGPPVLPLPRLRGSGPPTSRATMIPHGIPPIR